MQSGTSCFKIKSLLADLHALDLQLHVVLSRRLAIFPFLPGVSILPVLHLLPVVEDDAAILRPETHAHSVITALCLRCRLAGFVASTWFSRSRRATRHVCQRKSGRKQFPAKTEVQQYSHTSCVNYLIQPPRSSRSSYITSLVFHLRRSLGSPDRRGRHSSNLLGRNTFLGPLLSAQRDNSWL